LLFKLQQKEGGRASFLPNSFAMAEIEGGAPAQKPIHLAGEYESVRAATILPHCDFVTI
jgi:hypothetical protein